MGDLLPQYDSTAADAVLDADARRAVVDRLLRARTDLVRDASNSSDQGVFEPLDADFVNWPTRLLDDEAELSRIEETGAEFRERADEIVLLGIGGSSMGPRALFSALCDPYHNERPRDARRNAPRIYFEGDNLCLLYTTPSPRDRG